jgi:hypothetical protein
MKEFNHRGQTLRQLLGDNCWMMGLRGGKDEIMDKQYLDINGIRVFDSRKRREVEVIIDEDGQD